VKPARAASSSSRERSRPLRPASSCSRSRSCWASAAWAALPRRRQLALDGSGLLLGRQPIRREPLAFDAKVGLLDVEPRHRFLHTFPRGARALNRVPQRCRGVQRGEDVGARGLDVAFERLDLAKRDLVLLVRLGEPPRRRFPFGVGAPARLAALGDELCVRLPSGDQHRKLRVEIGDSRGQRGHLLPVELDLLLGALDLQFVRVRCVAGRRRGGVGFGHMDAQPADVAFDLGDTGGRGRVLFARFGQARLGSGNGL
jgi:hypothetical protein